MNPTALLVDSDPAQRAANALVVRALGYTVIAASTFNDARRYLLATESLELLIAAVRLGEFNGLHLALRARATHQNLAIIITDHGFDGTLKAEATRLSAAYLSRPYTPEELTAVITAQRPSRMRVVRRWPRNRVVPVVPAAVGPSAARVVNISYGGLCLELPRDEFENSLPLLLNVELKELGLSLQVHPVWADTEPSSKAVLCGGEVVASNEAALTQWRDFVDSMASGIT